MSDSALKKLEERQKEIAEQIEQLRVRKREEEKQLKLDKQLIIGRLVMDNPNIILVEVNQSDESTTGERDAKIMNIINRHLVKKKERKLFDL